MSRTPTARWVKLSAVALAVAAPVAVAIPYVGALLEKPAPDAAPDAATGGSGGPIGFVRETPFIMTGMRMPATKPAHEAELPAAEPVLGVTAAGRHRAYRVAAMRRFDTHVINDLVGGSAVTVTYHPQADVARVFTREGADRVLDVYLGGFRQDELILRLDGRFFAQATRKPSDEPGGDPPGLRVLPHTRTTWKAWRDAYPDTDVYIGRSPEETGAGGTPAKP